MSKVNADSVVRLLNAIGNTELCKGCQKAVWFIRTKKGKVVSVYANAEPHNISCGGGQ